MEPYRLADMLQVHASPLHRISQRAKEDRSMAELFRKILSPVYFDATSPAALEYARHFARQNDGVVYLLHVVPRDELHLLRKVYRPAAGGGADTGWAEKVAREKLQTMAQEHL